MVRDLKERVIGAIVLVALVVLVVPVFLDGPPDNGEEFSERVPLPGQSEEKTQTVVLERVRDEPMPAQSGSEPEPAATEPAVTVTKNEPVTTPVTKPPEEEPQPVVTEPVASKPVDPAPVNKAPVTTSATGMFAVQLGSFSSQANAERLAADLRKQGFAAFLSQLTTDNGQLHRVRVGPQKDREAAEAMAARLAKAGHKGKVLPHP